MANDDIRYIDQNGTPLTFGPHTRDKGGANIRESVVGQAADGYDASGVTPVGPLTFVATGQSTAFAPLSGRDCYVRLDGTFVGTVQLEEKSPNSAAWRPITAAAFQLYVWTGPANESYRTDMNGVQLRLNCTAYTSGTINYLLEQ